MKLNKLILSAALVAAGALATAQTVSFHGYEDYSFFPGVQSFTTTSDTDTWSYTDVYADEGSWYNGRTELNANVTAANFQFNLGVRLNSSLGSWYDLYRDQVAYDSTKDAIYNSTLFHQGNMTVSFFNNQVRAYLGKFEEWNLDYVYNGYQFGGQEILELASRDVGQHFTAVEVSPYKIPGFKALVGVPIIPANGNGTDLTLEYNNWKNLWRTAKLAAQYKVQALNLTFNFGFRPGLYCTSYTYTPATDFSTTSVCGEGYLQADMPSIIPGVKLNATYDMRYRYNTTVEKWTTAHCFDVSGQFSPLGNVTVNFENRTGYAAAHYAATNDVVFHEWVGAGATYNIPGTSYVAGLALNGIYAQDTNGTIFSGGGMSAAGRIYWDLTVDGMPCAANPTSGSTGRYIVAYAFPSFQKNFQNGYVKSGVELQYSRFSSANTTQCVAWRVPMMFCFWF